MTTKLPAAFSPEVMAELARPYSPADLRFAQLAEDIEAKWYAVEIRSRDVVDELIKRRFGIYLPEYAETVVKRGRKVTQRGPMFPGYVFVFLWQGLGNYRRIASIDGVLGLLGALNDEEISLVRAVENGQRWTPEKKRRHHNKRASARRLESCLEQLRSIDSEKRNQALRKLIGLS